MSASAQLPRAGDMIAGKYVLDRLLGQGGMGAVFAARHLKLAKNVAIKIMLADASNPEASQRFINEGRAAANIQNEHVVRVDDVDEEMGYAYMVLELLDGHDLAQLLEAEPTKRIAPHIAVNYVMQGLRGVAQAHALGIVHRDLKPSNLFLAKRKDGTAVVKVLDFGISKATNQSGLGQAVNALTSTKAMLGSPLYMSPEQLRNAKSVDHRADIWAMGVILYELITGALPFMGDNLGELFAAILETDPLPLRQRAGDAIPNGLNDVVMRCLQRKPEQRFQSAAELMQALLPFEQPMIGAGTNVGMGPQGRTAFIPQGNIQTAAAQAQAAQAAHAQSQQKYAIQTDTSNTGPHLQAVRDPMALRPATASQPNLAAVSALGGPPPALVQTTSGWQQGPNVAPGVPKSRLPLAIGIFAAVGVVFGVLGGLYVVKSRAVDTNNPQPPPSASIAEPTSSAKVVATNDKPTNDKPVDPTPTPATSHSAEPAVSVAVPTPQPAVAPSPVAHKPNPIPAKPQPQPQSQPQPASQPDPKPVPVPTPAPGPKPNNGGLEGHR